MDGGGSPAAAVAGSAVSLRLTVVEGVVAEGGPPLHVHTLEDEVVIVLGDSFCDAVLSGRSAQKSRPGRGHRKRAAPDRRLPHRSGRSLGDGRDPPDEGPT